MPAYPRLKPWAIILRPLRGERGALFNMSLARDGLGSGRRRSSTLKERRRPTSRSKTRTPSRFGGRRRSGGRTLRQGSSRRVSRKFSAAPPGLEGMVARISTVETVGYYPSAPLGRKDEKSVLKANVRDHARWTHPHTVIVRAGGHGMPCPYIPVRTVRGLPRDARPLRLTGKPGPGKETRRCCPRGAATSRAWW